MQRFKVGLCVAFLSFFGSSQSQATNYQPWLGELLQFEWRNTLLYQNYTQFSSGPHLRRYASDDFFLNTSLSNAIPQFGLEAEIVAASTRHQREWIDHFKLTGRYVWQDDVAGDPLTVTTGLSFSKCFRHSLKDISSFHHGLGEAELFLSVGKEMPEETWWISRWWSMAALGIAERGSPWLRFNVSYEKRWHEKDAVELFVHSLWGLGHKRLHLHDFHGYGPVQHQSVDLGLRYVYELEFFGNVSLTYAYRVHARSFPVRTHSVLAQLLYVFGL